MNSFAFQMPEGDTAKDRILEPLNDNQREVVLNYNGLCGVAAGPGAGKTKTMVSRTAYMIEDGVPASSILMFTFTRKAADEMRERVKNYVGDRGSAVMVSTYHSFCMRLLRRFGNLMESWNRHFTIIDTADRKTLLTEILHGMTGANGITPGQLGNAISDYMENMLTPQQALESANSADPYEGIMADGYRLYMAECKRQNVMDFDCLIYFAIRLIEKYPSIREQICQQYRYIIADEFQDSSPRDLRLIFNLGASGNVCCVFDDDQSIYGFRGVQIQKIYEFLEKNHFRHYELGQNYRSTQAIVNAARSVIEQNNKTGRMNKDIFSENQPGMKISMKICPNEKCEALHATAIIRQMKRLGVKYKDIAILYRMSYQSKAVEDELLKNGIPYQVVNGSAFYERLEVKDLLAYLRFLVNPKDETAMERAINAPKRGVGDKTINKIKEFVKILKNKTSNPLTNINNDVTISVRTDTQSLTDILQAMEDVKLGVKTKHGVQTFVEIMKALEQDEQNGMSPADILQDLIRLTQYKAYVEKSLDNKDDRIGNIDKLVDIARTYPTLDEFLGNMIVNQKDEDKEDTDKVNLMTMHASKGLEWPVVIVIGMAEGVCPHRLSIEGNNVPEERRLFYVAMTRAKKLLCISYPEKRIVFARPQYSEPSRFLKEIDKKYVVVQEWKTQKRN